MNDKDTSPEEKLLKMLDKPEVSVASGGRGKTSGGAGLLPLVKTANAILLLALIGAGIFLGLVVKSGSEELNTKINIPIGAGAAGLTVSHISNIPTAQELSYYLETIKQRNIFKPYENRVAEVKSDSPIVSSIIDQKTSNLKLVGIAWLNKVDTASAMIEDTASGKTYVVKKDETLNDLTVKTIYAESVALSYKDEEIILAYDKPKL